jgi:indole-3-glycerol phosphate synthase
MATYLDRILLAHREAAAADLRDLEELRSGALAAPPARGFAAALASTPGVSLIAEVKRASPSKGPLAPDLEPDRLARDYEAGGASALSVLTDQQFFLGSVDDLVEARAAVGLPVLRKDFTVCPADVLDARIMGADAVLLIVAALQSAELPELLGLAVTVGLDALVEVHDESEAESALSAGATLIGVNQRDLVSFEVDTQRAVRVASYLPPGITLVAESGIRDRADVARLGDAGFDAVLVGESLVSAQDPRAAAASLIGGAGANPAHPGRDGIGARDAGLVTG